VNKFKMDPNRFAAAGMGWDVPADPNDPDNQAKNRRVEFKVLKTQDGATGVELGCKRARDKGVIPAAVP
jgi:hypothetical protein